MSEEILLIWFFFTDLQILLDQCYIKLIVCVSKEKDGLYCIYYRKREQLSTSLCINTFTCVCMLLRVVLKAVSPDTVLDA